MPVYKWQPTLEAFFEAHCTVLSDKVPSQYDAVFVHGAPLYNEPDLEDQLLGVAAAEYHAGKTKKIVINGITAAACRKLNLAYIGAEPWYLTLKSLRVREKDIVVLPASAYTPIESGNLLQMAKEKKWKKLAILSHQHHQLRCFLQIIYLMFQQEFFPDVYNLKGPNVPWDKKLEKPVMGNAPPVIGKFGEHIGAELDRIVYYAQEPEAGEDGKPKHVRNATFEQMTAYLKKRK